MSLNLKERRAIDRYLHDPESIFDDGTQIARENHRRAKGPDLAAEILVVLMIVIAVWAILDWASPDVRSWMQGGVSVDVVPAGGDRQMSPKLLEHVAATAVLITERLQSPGLVHELILALVMQAENEGFMRGLDKAQAIVIKRLGAPA